MRKALKGVGVLLAIVLVWLAIVATGWLPRPTPRQLAAREALTPEPASAKGERNAFPTMHASTYDVPADQVDERVKADVAAFSEWVGKPVPKEPFVSTMEGKFPKVAPSPTTAPELCGLWDPDCLVRVRRDPEATRATLARFTRQLEVTESFDRFDHYHYEFEPSWEAPVQAGVNFALVLSAAALDYADGKTDAAFARVCRGARGWRTLRAHADMLIPDMIGVAVISGSARLYADMLAEQPRDFVPPCADTFASLSDAEFDQCATFHWEYQSFRSTLHRALFGKGGSFADGQDRFTATAMHVLLNREHVDAMTAGMFGPYCMAAHRERVARRSAAKLELDPGCSGVDWAVDPLGCAMFAEMAPDFDAYYRRVLDADARLKLVQSAVWLRSQPQGTDLVAAFAKRPAELTSPEQPTSIDVDAGVLRMKPLDTKKGETWEIRFAKPAASAAG